MVSLGMAYGFNLFLVSLIIQTRFANVSFRVYDWLKGYLGLVQISLRPGED